MPERELAPLAQALLDPAAYPEPRPAHVELRETHISLVFLAGKRVYKVKKAVDLGFLNYSTFARRAAYCRRELQLNQRFAPGIYLDVVPIVERGGRVLVDERGGRVLERAVRMRRLPEDGMLPGLLTADTVPDGLAERMAARLAAVHAAAPRGPSVARFGRPAAVRRLVLGNLERAEPFVGRTLSAERYQHLHHYTTTFLAEQRLLLRGRAAAGRIHEGHGDLHAANVCVVDGEPVFFDCIDFSPSLRCTDVVAEIAFPAMDLAHYGRADLAATFLHAFDAALPDPDLVTLLPFYLCYRATVRGLVASIQAAGPESDAAERAEQEALARAYFDQADHAYAGAASRPLLLLLGGLPASGKSTLARALAGRLALVPLNSDVVRKQRAGLAPTTRAAEALYAPNTSVATYAALRDEARRWLAQGVSVALDASHRLAQERAAAVTLADELGVPWLAVECGCAPEAARARLAARAADPAAVSDADWRIYQQLAAEWEPWTELPPARHVVVDTGGSLETAIDAVLAAARRL